MIDGERIQWDRELLEKLASAVGLTADDVKRRTAALWTELIKRG